MTYKRKNYLLGICGAIMVFLALFVSVRPTWSLYEEICQMKYDIDQVHNAPKNIHQLRKELNQYNSSLSAFSKESFSHDQYILNRVSVVAKRHHVLLTSLSPPEFAEQENYKVETRRIRFRGTYINILKAIYSLEFIYPIGRITGVKFYLEDDRKTKRLFLFADFFIQNLRSKQNEE